MANRSPPARSSPSARVGRIAGWFMLLWLGGTVIQAVFEMRAMMPHRPPTPAEVRRDRPRADAEWARVYPRLAARLPAPPDELGEVWATSALRLCGLVDDRESGLPDMRRFY